MRIQLQCGHTSYVQGIPVDDYLICDEEGCDGREVKLYAIETREWKAKCYECRFARWTGQSLSSAQNVADQHWRRTNHDSSVDYLSNPALKDEVRQVWGRKVKVVVLDEEPRLRGDVHKRTPIATLAASGDDPPFLWPPSVFQLARKGQNFTK